MNNDYQSKGFKKWLDKLQQESWQLELIISGFAIYGLFIAIDPVDLKTQLAYVNDNMPIVWVWTIAGMALYILLFNLMLHVLLRGLWIGAIGLRYVSGDIDYEKLNYSKKFTSFLKRKVGSFDRYISTLENYCSILFAITFLLIFYIIGAFLAIVLIGYVLSKIPSIAEELNKPITFLLVFFVILILLSTLITFIDFLGQGFLKRRKWTSKIYFPIYRIFGVLTLSFLYRPLIYNFLDNKLGKRLSILLVPIYIGIIFIYSMDYSNSNYLNSIHDSSEFQSFSEHYENLSTKENTFIKVASIPSKVIEKQYLKVFMLYNKSVEDFIFEKNVSLKPEEDNRGFQSSFAREFKRGIDAAAGKKDTIDISLYLKTVNQLYELKIDNTNYGSDFTITKNSKNRIGFETYLNIKSLSEGKHILKITGPIKENKFKEESKTVEKTIVTIPFWYFPQNTESTSNFKVAEIEESAMK